MKKLYTEEFLKMLDKYIPSKKVEVGYDDERGNFYWKIKLEIDDDKQNGLHKDSDSPKEDSNKDS